MRIAILAIVEDGKPPAEAAKAAGLTKDAIRKAMSGNAAAREFYNSELKALMYCAKAKAAHALIKELDGPNAAARVAAARTLLEESDRSPAGNNMPQVPAFCDLDCRCAVIISAFDRCHAVLPTALAARSQAELDNR